MIRFKDIMTKAEIVTSLRCGPKPKKDYFGSLVHLRRLLLDGYISISEGSVSLTDKGRKLLK